MDPFRTHPLIACIDLPRLLPNRSLGGQFELSASSLQKASSGARCQALCGGSRRRKSWGALYVYLGGWMGGFEDVTPVVSLQFVDSL